MRRRLLLCFLTSFIVALAGLAWVVRPPHRITLEAFRAIAPGMTRQDVAGVLQSPPRRYFEDLLVLVSNPVKMLDAKECSNNEAADKGVWLTDRYMIVIDFDANGLVIDGVCHKWFPVNESFWSKLRRRFGHEAGSAGVPCPRLCVGMAELQTVRTPTPTATTRGRDVTAQHGCRRNRRPRTTTNPPAWHISRGGPDC